MATCCSGGRAETVRRGERRTTGHEASPAEVRELRVAVESIAAGGDGVARAGGLVVFLPRTAPGDEGVATAAVGRSFARGRLTTLEVASRSEEHTSELQSRENLVCRLLLEKEKLNTYHALVDLRDPT